MAVRRKYGNKKVTADGYVFDSKLEEVRYQQLKIFERAGEITDLVVHPKYELIPGCKLPSGKRQAKATWTADFEYIDSVDGKIIEDVKSPPTARKDAFRLRVKLFQYLYGIEVRILFKEHIL